MDKVQKQDEISKESLTTIVDKNIESSKDYEDILRDKFLNELTGLDFSNLFRDALRHALDISHPLKEEDANTDDRFCLVGRLIGWVCFDNKELTDIKNWVEKDYIFPMPNTLYVVYHICLGLGLNIEQTKDFCRKGCMLSAFDLRRAKDVVFYYCISNKDNKDIFPTLNEAINKAYELIQQAESELKKPRINDDRDPSFDLPALAKQCKNEDSLMDYIRRNCQEKGRNFSHAYKIIENLEKNVDNKLAFSDGTIVQKNDSPSFSSAYSNKGKERGKMKEGKEKLISDMKSILKMTENEAEDVYHCIRKIEKCFPVRSGKSIKNYSANDKSELIRRRLIVLYFNSYFRNCNYDEDTGLDAKKARYNDFRSNLNNILLQCGYMKMYSRNPFDFLILKCASKCIHFNDKDKNAVNALRSIVDLFIKGDSIDKK